MTLQTSNILFQFSEKFGLYVMPVLAGVWVIAFAYWTGKKVASRRHRAVAIESVPTERQPEWKACALVSNS